MPFEMVGRTGPGIRQVYSGRGLGIGQREGVILGANMKRPIVTSGDFAAARLLLGEFLELQARRAGELWRLRARCG